MFCVFIFLVKSEVRDKLDLPILRRIAEDDQWPPLNIYIYPISKFPSKFHNKTKNPRWEIENSLPDLIKKSPINFATPEEADLYLVPISLSDLTIGDFGDLIDFLQNIGPWYNEYKGANHIFLHSRYSGLTTCITKQNFLLHQGHIITEGYKVEGEYVKTWVYAKNLLFPLQPFTKKIDKIDKKIDKIAVDVSIDGCKSENIIIRRKLLEYVKNRPEFSVAYNKEDAIKMIEDNQYAIITACESEMAQQFYDAINSLTVPIVLNNVMRFPFESELIDYTRFVVHLDEFHPENVTLVIPKLRPHLNEIIDEMIISRKMFEYTYKNGGYIWAIAWSLYMKLLSWLPIRRTKIIDNIFREPNVFTAT